ncbi:MULTISPECIES: ATP-binding protein [unclassified Bradyrhizobium]|uniref:ATP-binding protein n=1 Tax=unclassified Bradyrhizobium TaxID=2631580 RepID=UPI001BA4F69B|nr:MULTISPECIES: ATP-binding protein [unclassified Bradyrhizobium]MBR1300378.1 GAF domain-containing protein [Bradyrhizobium sp. AUGA SZCCT0042]
MSPNLRTWVPSRLGVANRLLLAFLGISGLGVVGATVAIFSFRDIGQALDRITARRVPAALASVEVSRRVERIVSAAPALLSAATPADHNESSQRIGVEMQELAALLESLEHRGADSDALGSMRSAVGRLRTNLESLDKLVADRMIVSALKRGHSSNALSTHNESQSLLAPWLQIVEGEVAQSRRAFDDAKTSAQERIAAGSGLVRSTASYHALQRVQFLITSVSDRLQQISAASDSDSVRVQMFRIQQSLRETRQITPNLDPRLQPLLIGRLEEFRALVEGINSIPELRLQELGIVAQATRNLTENAALSRDLTQAANRLVSIANRDIVQANDEAFAVQRFSSTVLIAAVALSLLSSIGIVWLYVGRNIVSRLTALSRSMLAIAEGNLATSVPTGGSDEISEMGRVVEVLRKNTLERNELLIEREQTAVRLEKQVEARTIELARSVEELRALGEVSQAVNSTIDLQTVLSTIISKAVQLSGTDAGTIYAFDDARQEFRLRASYGMDEALVAAIKDRNVRLGETLISEAAIQRRPVQVADISKDPTLVLDIIRRAGFRALLAVPLLGADRIVGALVVRRKQPGDFPQGTVNLLQTFGAQSVLAIQNARLFDEVQSRTRELAKSLEGLRATQDRLVQTEKLASLGQLTAGIAHEIKNPLNFVNNFSAVSVELVDELREALARASLAPQLRGEISEISDMLQDNLDRVVQHGKRADSIVKNMLLHSRQGSGEHQPTDINAVVEESLNLAYHGARAEKQDFNVTLEKSFDPAAGEVDMFPQEITRVLLNLISNGFYAATKRNLEANGRGYEPTLAVLTRNLGESVEIKIHDNGTGIPAEVKEKMFDPFFTTKPPGEGTGLGLSLSYDIIVKQHAGSIEVDTQPGQFTEFRIVLPRRAAKLAQLGERS